MNEWDRQNLEFLLSASPIVLRQWYDNVDQDDREYAFELLDRYSEELKLKSELLKDNVTDVSEASQILQDIFRIK